MAFKGGNGDKEDQSKQNPSGSTHSKKVEVVTVTPGKTTANRAATGTLPPSLPGTPSPDAASSSAAPGTKSDAPHRQATLPATKSDGLTKPPRPAVSGPRQPAPSTAPGKTAKQTAHLGGSPVPGHRTPQPYTPAPPSTQVGDDASPVSSPSAHSADVISELHQKL